MTIFKRQTTRDFSCCSFALEPASIVMAPTPPSKPTDCCTPTVARVTLRLVSPRGIVFKPSMTASMISDSRYSQKAMPL